MFNDIKKGIKAFKRAELESEEKGNIRASLVSYMEFHPVMEEAFVRPIKYRSLLEVLTFAKFMPIALLIALLFSGGVSFAAERALPGDILYPVKVKVNEEVRGLVALNEEDKAEWESKRAERRLEEAEKLAISGELKQEIIAKLEDNFEDHADKVEDKIAKLEEKGNAEAALRLSSALEIALDSHERVIAALSASSTATSSVKLVPLGLLVKNKAEVAAKVQEKVEESFDELSKEEAKAAAEGKIGAAENKIESTKKFLELKKGTLEEESYVNASLRLASSTEALKEAKELLSSEKYFEAFMKAKLSMDLAQKAKAAVAIHLELDKKINFKTIINGHASSSDEDEDEDEVEETDDDKGGDREDRDNDDDDKEDDSRGRGKIDLDIEL